MRRKVIITAGVLVAACVLLAAGGACVALWNAPTMQQDGEMVVITNPGLTIRGAEIGLQVGETNGTVRLDELPGGVTRLPITRFDPQWRSGGPPASAGSLSGSRLGVSWTYYWALRLASPAQPTHLAGASEPK